MKAFQHGKDTHTGQYNCLIGDHSECAMYAASVRKDEATTMSGDRSKEQAVVDWITKNRHGHQQGDCAGDKCPDWQSNQLSRIAEYGEAARLAERQAVVRLIEKRLAELRAQTASLSDISAAACLGRDLCVEELLAKIKAGKHLEDSDGE